MQETKVVHFGWASKALQLRNWTWRRRSPWFREEL